MARVSAVHLSTRTASAGSKNLSKMEPQEPASFDILKQKR